MASEAQQTQSSKIMEHVLITGCSPGGIGHALAREFHHRGFRVLATARRTEIIADLDALGIVTLALDVDKPESIAALKEEVERITNGKLDMLVNNAGRNYTVPALELDFAEVEQTFRTNVFGVMRMCQTFAPLLIAAKGTIVQLGSIAGVMPYVFGSAYNASKAALHSYSNTLRVELAPFDVQVVIIVTGGVKSNIARMDRVLQKDSMYIDIEAEYMRRTKHSQEVGMNNGSYARYVVLSLLHRRKPREVWAGSMAKWVWFLNTFMPGILLDTIFYRMFNLWKVKQALVSKRKSS